MIVVVTDHTAVLARIPPRVGRAIIVSLLCCAPAVGRAQEGPEAQDAIAPATPEEAPAPDPLEEARERLARGEGLYDAGDFEGALAEFRALDLLLERHPLRPLAVWNMGRAAERLHRYDEAIALYERYLTAPEPDGRYLAGARERLATLAELLGTVELSVRLVPPSDAVPEIWIDHHRAEDGLSRVRLPGGRHTIEVRLAGRSPAMQEVELVAGRMERVQLVLEPAARGLEPTPFHASSVLAAVSLVGALVLGSIALSEHRWMADCAQELGCQAEHGWIDATTGAATAAFDAETTRLRALAITTDALIGLTAAAAISATVLALLTDFSASDDDSTIGVVLDVDPRSAALGVRTPW